MFLFAELIVIYREYSTKSSKQLLGLGIEFSEAERYKTNEHKSVAFLYTTNSQSEIEIKRAMSFKMTLKIFNHVESMNCL